MSRAQDVEAGDGTTTVVVIAGAFLDAAEKLLDKGIHPTAISESFQRAAGHAIKVRHFSFMKLDYNISTIIYLVDSRNS